MNKKEALCLLLLLECGEDSEDGQDESGCDEDAVDVEEPRPGPSRKIWVREELKKRNQLGEFSTNFAEERLNAGAFHAANRMTPARFEEILLLVGHRLQRQTTTFRQPIPPAERLALTVRYLASGQSQEDIARSFRVGRSTTSKIIKEVCSVLWDELAPNEMKPPTQEDWLAIAQEFGEKWHFPHCLGAIDGKHINIQAPQLSGSLLHNDKGTSSTILLAVADGNYCFVCVDIGSYSSHDGAVLVNSALGKGLDDGSLNLPPPPGDGLNYVLLGDETFPLKNCLMRPYPGRSKAVANRHKRLVFNYRLSRARRVVENTIGILVTKWKIFRQAIIADVETIGVIVKAATVLHNFLRRRDGTSTDSLPYIGPDDVDVEHDGQLQRGAWRSQSVAAGALVCPRRLGSNNASRDTMALRDRFADYLSSPEGAVSWQDRVVRDGELGITEKAGWATRLCDYVTV